MDLCARDLGVGVPCKRGTMVELPGEGMARRRGITNMKIISEIFRPEPQVLYLEPFFGCNYNCFFCIHGSGRKIQAAQLGPHLFDKLKPVIDKVNHIHMTGLGEPFLNRHLLDYLGYFRDSNKSYYLNTNGSLIEDAHIDLMSASRCELSVSLDAGDRETYEKVRYKSNWDNVMSRLKKVSRVKAERKSPYPLLYLTFHINSLNLMSLKKVPELCRDLGIEAVKFSWTILPEAYRARSIFWHQDAATQVLHNVSAQLQRHGIHVRTEALFSKHVRGCWNHGSMTFVGATGAVAACCSRWPAIGHLSENSFQDIWNGMPRRNIALAILNGAPQGVCKHCPQFLGVNYQANEEDFLKSEDLETEIVAEKNKNIGRLPSLEGLGAGFSSSVSALTKGDFQGAASALSNLESKFPDYFEIKNNLAVALFYLGNVEKCMEILHTIGRIPHNDSILRSNLESLRQLLNSSS
jgi:MoaA/NifB/PqqE/SkfB family radical SAM enzyme